MIKIPVLTNIQYSDEQDSSDNTLALAAEFARAVANSGAKFALSTGPHIAPVNTGRIEDDRPTDTAKLRTLFEHLRSNGAEIIYSAASNEDLQNIPGVFYEDVTGCQDNLFTSEYDQSIQITVFNPLTNKDDLPQYWDFELQWLEAAIRNADRPVIILSPTPINGDTFKNADKAREIIQSSGKVVMCIAGNNDTTQMNNIDGIPYLTVKGLSQGDGQATYAMLDIDLESKTIKVETKGHEAQAMQSGFAPSFKM